MGAAAEAPVPACSTIPTTTNLALLDEAPGWTGPHEASQEVSCLPYTSAVPVLPPIRVLIGEPSKASAPDTEWLSSKCSESPKKFSTFFGTGTVRTTLGVMVRTVLPAAS